MNVTSIFRNNMADNQIPPKRVVFLSWQGHLCYSRVDFIRDLLRFGKDVKVFLNKYYCKKTLVEYN